MIFIIIFAEMPALLHVFTRALDFCTALYVWETETVWESDTFLLCHL